MSKKSEVGSAMGKLWAVIGAIMDRIRKRSERDGGGFTPEFVEWLAYKATDFEYDRAIGGLLNAWQASVAEEQNLERMSNLEWIKVTACPVIYAEASEFFPQSGGFRCPTFQELSFAVDTARITSNEPLWMERRSLNSPLLAFYSATRQILEVSEDTKCGLVFVRDKKRLARV